MILPAVADGRQLCTKLLEDFAREDAVRAAGDGVDDADDDDGVS